MSPLCRTCRTVSSHSFASDLDMRTRNGALEAFGGCSGLTGRRWITGAFHDTVDSLAEAQSRTRVAETLEGMDVPPKVMH